MIDPSLLSRFAARVRGNRPVALATVVDGDDALTGTRMLLDRSGPLDGGFGTASMDAAVASTVDRAFGAARSEMVEVEGRRVFVEIFLPPPRLIVVGAVHITSTLTRLAHEVGFRVVVCDARDRFATPERFPEVDELILGWPSEVLSQLELDDQSYVVVVTHDAKLDNPALVAALASPAPYVGALGSRRTHARRAAALEEAGVSADDLARIHAPIGLDIGASTPQEIALSIIAEVVSARNTLLAAGAGGE